MHQQIKPANKTAVRTSTAFILIVTIVTLSICFLLFNALTHTKKTHYTNTKIELPQQDTLQNASTKSNKATEWTVVTTRPGDSMASVFKHLGLSQQTLYSIVNKNPYAKNLTGIKPNQQIQFLIHNKILESLILPINATQVLVVTHKDNKYISKINSRAMNSHNQYITATVRGSLYGTAQRLNIPHKLIQQMTEIFNWEIDFARDIRAGDQFSILYNAFYVDDKLVGTGNILAVSYTNRGKTHQAIRHIDKAGNNDYYTPEGISLKKAFSRYPIKFSHISSPFSLSRQHPILHFNRAHKGVDLAAAIGTPIHATANGRIAMIGRQSDYGNMIKVTHDKTYSSVYGHLLKFQKGLSKGDVVKRGQIIGYVGQTGLATGPHCHYEFHVNHIPNNPATISLPRSSPVAARERSAFKINANTLLARLKLYEEGNLAGNTSKKSTNLG